MTEADSVSRPDLHMPEQTHGAFAPELVLTHLDMGALKLAAHVLCRKSTTADWLSYPHFPGFVRIDDGSARGSCTVVFLPLDSLSVQLYNHFSDVLHANQKRRS
ncbi:MAG: hypothetical protein SOY30_02960 [Eubacteriales bacterium]|nr:hypothetical protein [Eubacteriales bacterium]